MTINSQSVQDYARSIEPIFQEKCATCHNHSVRQGGLNLESYEALMNGGKRGSVVVPGKSNESRLVKMLEGSLQPRMPVGDSLSNEEIKVIKAWIDAGAPGPSAASGRPIGEPSDPSHALKARIPEIKPSSPVKAAVGSLAFHPGGRMIAVGRYLEVELTDPTKRSIIGKLSGHAEQIRALAFSPDGSRLAAGGGSPAQFGEVKIWSVADRKEIFSIRGHRDNIFGVAFSPDGTRLATCSYDRLIKLWDATTGKEIKTLKDHTDAVFGVAFSPDGRRLASASADRTVKIWDTATGQRVYTLSDSLDAVNTVAFHPSGKLLAAAGADRTIRVWELGDNEGRQIKSLIAHEDAVNRIAFSPDGKTLASTAADKRIKIWDFSKLEEIHTTEIQPDWVFALSFSPDGKRLAIGRYDGSIAFYETATGKKL
ncbi:MAG: c-type cytochrome domain-containing protein, partial [Blastocatellia bacterium]